MTEIEAGALITSACSPDKFARASLRELRAADAKRYEISLLISYKRDRLKCLKPQQVAKSHYSCTPEHAEKAKKIFKIPYF